MFGKILAGTMDAEVERVTGEPPPWEKKNGSNGEADYEHEAAPSEPDNFN
jgi:hypothetical protein